MEHNASVKRSRFIPLAAVALLAVMPPALADVVLDVSGGDTELEANLRTRLRLLAETCDAPAWRVRRLFKQAEQDLTPALRAFGYYRPSIEKTLTTDGDCWQARLRIEPGERVRVRRRTVALILFYDRGHAQARRILAGHDSRPGW